jgi:YebC/PmpR family DNA-binding regulatory protein
MSGHSKWASIKREKGANDTKRGALFTRIGNQIAIAARGGTDPVMNPALAMTIEKAKAANMPLANIERAIKRVADKAAVAMIEVLYEGYGPAGVAILVECATDNINRTYPEVKLAFSKNGGSIAEKGSVAFQFDRKGLVRVKASGEEALLQALDAGADDVEENDGELSVYTDPKQLAQVRTALIEQKMAVIDAELTYVPKSTTFVDDEASVSKIMKIMDALEDLNDVVATHTNFGSNN